MLMIMAMVLMHVFDCFFGLRAKRPDILAPILGGPEFLAPVLNKKFKRA
jgi:hypothetical protein